MKLGRFETNHIYNEDCYQAIKEMPDKSVDLVYIDIPYDIDYNGKGCLHSKINNALYGVMQDNGQLTNGIDYSILDELCRVMKYIYIYIWCSKSQIYDLMKYFIEKHKCLFQILVWCKTNPIPFGASNFLSDKEYCFCFYESGVKFNDGWNHKGTYYVSKINTEDKKEFVHPTIKPIEFVKNHILNSTKENDIVLDCFLGSGTTAVTCKELNRQYIGFEINPEYYKIACDRLNGITVKQRKQIESGMTTIFDFIEE